MKCQKFNKHFKEKGEDDLDQVNINSKADRCFEWKNVINNP